MSPNSIIRVAGVFGAATVAVGMFGCGSKSIIPPPPAISISISNPTATVQESTTAQFTATVVNDSGNKGVAWAVSCSATSCGSVSPKATASDIATTYTAPGPPATDLTVMLKASAVADPTKSASATISVAALAVALSPTSATVQVNSSLQVTGVVNNDASNGNVNWTLTQNGASCSPACGTISATSTTNGSAISYTAPVTPPATNLTVMLTGTSATDPSKSSSATLLVPSVLVTVAPVTPTVLGTGNTSLKATLTNDASNKGVSWSVSCASATCGTVSPASTAAGMATTYSAPPPPINDLQVTVTATSIANPDAIGVATVTVPAIVVDVEPVDPTVIATSTQQFTASVSNDLSNGGVTWSLSCSPTPCGSISPTSTASGAPTTYTAPPLSSTDLTVNIIATPVANPANAVATSATVPAILVSNMEPTSGIIPISSAQAFTADVSNDPTSQGLNWTLTQNGANCSPACGTMNPSSAASGATSTFTGPATMPSSGSVSVNAVSIGDPSKSATAAITLTNGTVRLIPGSLSFSCKAGFTCPPPTQKVTLTNTGATALTISGISSTGSFSQSNGCGSSVGSKASCTITVAFTAGKAGTYNGTVVIQDSSSDSPQQFRLSGTVQPPRLGNGTQAIDALAFTNSAAVPTPTGTNVVGTRVLEWADASRPDPYRSDGSKRLLGVRLWYPVSSQSNQTCQSAEYASSGVWKYFAQLVGVRTFPVATNSCMNAAVAEGIHPVVVFTPGYTGTYTDYTFLMEDLASRGYVVVAVNHTYEATAVQFADGRVVRSLVGSHLGGPVPRDLRSLSFAVDVRLRDIKFVLTQIARLNSRRGTPFVGKLDLSKVVVAGHSLGGLAALLTNQSDPHVKGAILIDPVLPDVLTTRITKPVLILAADRKQWTANECRLWSHLQGSRLAVSLQGTEHVALSDWIWLTPDALRTGPMGPQKTMSAVRDYVAAFLDANLRGEPADPLLNGPSSIYPNADITTQKQALCSEP